MSLFEVRHRMEWTGGAQLDLLAVAIDLLPSADLCAFPLGTV